MREKHTVQKSIFHFFADHEIGQELQAISDWLDNHPELLDWVAADLQPLPVASCGRQGLPVESVLRCALLKQYRQVSYEELAFYLIDSYSFQAFARLPLAIIPKKAVLQRTISRISEATWEKINQVLLRHAQVDGLERGQVLRMDSTATDSTLHEPTDSGLLWDSVRYWYGFSIKRKRWRVPPHCLIAIISDGRRSACAPSATRAVKIRKRPCTRI